MKKTFRKTLALLLSVMMIISIIPLTASAETYGDLTYTISNGEVTITDCDSAATEVVIPESIDNYPITGIGHFAFSDCRLLSSIKIPDSVTNIGVCAFSDCTSLTRIEIPNSVTIINDGVFQGCQSLKSITIHDSITNIGAYAFDFCTSLINIEIPCSVTNIGNNAFSYCNALAIISVNEKNEYYSNDEYGVLFNKNKTILIQYPIGNERTEYIIPDSVTNIVDNAFNRCSSLTNIEIPNSVTNLGDSAFAWCDSLTSITIPDSVTSINNGTFNSCKSLSSITIPDSITRIDQRAFSNCTSLKNIKINNPYCEIYDSSFTINSSAKIYGACGSTAQSYAEKYNRNFVAEHYYSTQITAPTCTDQGYTTYICECGDTYVADYVDTNNDHADEDADYICDNCGAEIYNDNSDKDNSANCSHICHKSGFIGVIWKIINFLQKLFGTGKYCECGVAHY